MVECGKSFRKIGQAERSLIEKSVSRFVNPLDSFLETDIKTITVCILHNYLVHLVFGKAIFQCIPIPYGIAFFYDDMFCFVEREKSIADQEIRFGFL